MPVFTCPTCGDRLYVRRDQLRRAVCCPICPGGVRLEPPPFQLRTLLRPSHPAGWWFGAGLLGVGVALASLASWSAAGSGGEFHQALRARAVVGTAGTCLSAAFASGLAGSLLVTRWRHADRGRWHR
jgi:hypothetical protein